MNTWHILLRLVLSLLGTGLWAQDRLPQVFSPNAAELGKYGKIPVSYFNGLPNISIPLTELKAKGYTLPIYLTYHAGGNKPDQHPGWVGLGWTLHAGGCINRIVNGMKDELTNYEAENLYNLSVDYSTGDAGYLYHAKQTQEKDWDNVFQLDTLSKMRYFKEFEPDEFQVCLDGIEASFYITGENEIQIVSGSDVDFSIEWSLCNINTFIMSELFPAMFDDNYNTAIESRLYTYISEITLTNHDGVKYLFGRDMNAIEFSTDLYGTVLASTPNTWLLSSIETPDGEVISFRYEKEEGFNLIKRDVHTKWSYTEYGENISFPYSYDSDLIQDEGIRNSISFSLLQPSYLASISCRMSGDTASFSRTSTVEAAYDYTAKELRKRFIDFSSANGLPFETILDADHYCQLISVTHKGKQISFEYTHSTDIRLHLQSVSFNSGASTNQGGSYSFQYNDQIAFPGYNSKKTDKWNYFNDVYYGDTTFTSMELVRQPNAEKMRLEIMTRLTYPTGGYTLFEYEPHSYSKVMRQFPFEVRSVDSPLDSIAGGLRIKQITNVANTGTSETRVFTYEGTDGRSSGILSGCPKYYAYGKGSGSVFFTPPSSIFDWNIGEIEIHGIYQLESELPLASLSQTNGNHVTYSQVTESVLGNGKIVSRFSNHDNVLSQDVSPRMYENFDKMMLVAPFNSRQLFRGRLLSKSVFNKNGRKGREEEYFYHLDTLLAIKSAAVSDACGGWLKRVSYVRIYSDYPYLERAKIWIYPDNGSLPHVDTTDYTYDSHRNLTEVSRTSGGQMDVNLFTYPGNYPDSPVYSAMSASGRHAFPVEHVHAVDGVVSEAELTTWKQDGAPGDFVPAEMYQATPTDVPDFNVLYDGTNVDEAYGPPRIRYLDYDAHSNLLRSATPDGVETTYTWDKDSTHIRGLFMGAGRKTRYRIWSELARVTEQENLSLIHDRFYVGSFTSVADGAVTVNIWFDAGDERDIWGKIDSLTFHCPSPSVVGGLSPVYTVTFQLEAGRHTLLLSTREGVFPPIVPILNAPDQGSGGGNHVVGGERPLDPLDPVIIIDPTGVRLRGHMSLTYWGDPDYVHERDEQECAHYSFEGTGDTPDGFESEKSQQSAVTVHLVLNPDLTYTLDRRVKRNGKWVYERMPFVVNTTDQYELYAGGAPFDEVRIYADRVQPETYTWWPDGNLRSRTDARGVTESYEYDGLGRLIRVYDNERKKVEEYMYNYQNK